MHAVPVDRHRDLRAILKNDRKLDIGHGSGSDWTSATIKYLIAEVAKIYQRYDGLFGCLHSDDSSMGKSSFSLLP